MSYDMGFGDRTFTFNRVSELINDKRIMNIVEMEHSYRPWLSNELFYTVSDQNPGLSLIYNDDIIRIVKLAVLFYDKAFGYVADMSMKKLDLEALMPYTKQDRYCIEAYNGERVCTQREVDEAVVYVDDEENVHTITNKPVEKLDEREFKLINVLTWALTGRWKYYIAAGYPNPYENGKLKYSPAHYIMGIEKHIEVLCERIDEGKCDAVISKIRQIRKLGKYNYSNYAADEIEVDVPMSFVVTQVNKMIRKSKSTVLNMCFHILRENKLDLKRYSTEDKIYMRKGYMELNNIVKAPLSEEEQETRNEIKEIIDKLKDGVANGILKEDNFCMKVAFTIAKNDYRYCSEKQKNVLLNGLKDIDNHNKKEENKQYMQKTYGENAGYSGFELAGLSSLLGEGKLSDGEFCSI